MTNRYTMLPVLMIVVIVLLALVAMATGRTEGPPIEVNTAYPHQICNFNRYCEGSRCENGPIFFALYTNWVDGSPRLELPRINPNVSRDPIDSGHIYETLSGEIQGTLKVFEDGGLDWVAYSGPPSNPVEHFASGSCGELQLP